MRELTSLHVSMAGGAAASASADTAPVSAAAGAGGKKKAGKAAKPDAKEDEGKRPSSKRAKPSAGATGGAVKREPVDEQPLVLGASGGMAQRPGTSTGYEGAAVAGYMDVDADGDEVGLFQSSVVRLGFSFWGRAVLLGSPASRIFPRVFLFLFATLRATGFFFVFGGPAVLLGSPASPCDTNCHPHLRLVTFPVFFSSSW
jgi:hypothetical protein